MENLGRITLRCSCGSDQFAYPDDIDPNSDAQATDLQTVCCTACGATAQLGELKREAAAAVQNALADSFRLRRK